MEKDLIESQLKNNRILKACRGEPVDQVPIWLMRQAGRYLPEFRKVRETYDFFQMCRTPNIAALITLQPLERFPIDAVILFSDILVIPQALGFEVQMHPGVGPVFPNPLMEEDLDSRVLSVSSDKVIGELKYVYDAVEETIKSLNNRVPLIGFAGAPWTLMCYMVDGSGEEKKKEKFGFAINWLYEKPEASHKLLACLAGHIENHLVEQIQHGCHLVQLFDSWGGLISPALYREFGIPYIKKIAEGVKRRCPNTPMILFAKGANAVLEELSHLPFDVLSIDWTADPSMSRKIVDGRVGLQGNIDPLVLKCKRETIETKTREMLLQFEDIQHRYIANLGHGCLPDFDPQNVGAYIEAVQKISKELIASSKTENETE